jgi:hypothetical protein
VLTPAELEVALRGRRWDVVVLACCYGLSLDVAWSLRGAARYVVGAPGEVAVTGRELATGLSGAARGATVAGAARVAAASVRDPGGRAVGRWVEAGTLAVVGKAVEALAGQLRGRPAESALALEAVRPKVTAYGPSGELADAGSLADLLAEALAGEEGRSAARGLAEAARRAVGGAAKRSAAGAAAGLGLLCPSLRAEPSKDYEREVPFAKATGWAEALRAMHAAVVSEGGAL